MGVWLFVWWVSWGILLGYYLLIFLPGQTSQSRHDSPLLSGVSIVIAVKNGSRMLTQNLPALLRQQYPIFEIILVNDHSDLQERTMLEDLQNMYPNVKVIHSEKQPGKKQALSCGIEQATYDWILCADADCRPVSDQWIGLMMDSAADSKMVLGYSPYAHQKGFLSLFVRFETIMTGMQYLSWTMRGRPYMGVGRNLLYAKDLFLKMNPYSPHDLPYGDDDLWVQQAALNEKVALCFDAGAHVESDAPMTWHAWWRQKHRHLSAAHQYARSKWWQPGIFGIALILHWATLPFLLSSEAAAWLSGACLSGLAIRWLAHGVWLRRLKETNTMIVYPVLELIYTLYLAVMGMVAFFVKKKAWN